MRDEHIEDAAPIERENLVYRIDPDDYGYGNLPRYLGTWHSALGFMLFALGCAALLAFGMIALQIVGSDEIYGFRGAPWLAPLWGAVAVPLGLSMRRRRPSILLFFIGCAMLAVPFALATNLRI